MNARNSYFLYCSSLNGVSLHWQALYIVYCRAAITYSFRLTKHYPLTMGEYRAKKLLLPLLEAPFTGRPAHPYLH